MKGIISLMAGVLLWAGASQAQSLQLGIPEHAGTGCPIGTVAAVVSPDNTKLSLLFDQYVAEAGRYLNGKTMDRKGCNVAIPLTVPNGWSVSIVRVDYRGYHNIPRGGRARFDTEYFFAGMRSPRLVETFSRGGEDNYTLTDNVLIRGEVYSRCGAKENLRISTSLSVNSNRQGDDVIATLDSIDVDSEVLFHLQWRRCN